MDGPDLNLRCQHDREAEALAPVGDQLARCRMCGFLLPQARIATRSLECATIPELPGIAPGGVLRGKYRLIERLGEGAHGVSYLAEHVYLSHPCVVKILPYTAFSGGASAVARLRREARAGFRVHDPHVVRVLDCDVVSGVWYFVMEYVDGADLAAIPAHGQRMTWQQAVQVGVDAGHGLLAVHAAGLVHRDIKPGNLILGVDGQLRIADLGVASFRYERTDPTLAGGNLAGTLAYTAPELFRAHDRVGPAIDLYSLGVTLYQLLTGRLPHGGGQVFRRLIDLQCRPVSWPDDAAPEVPLWLVKVVLRLLAIEPQDRIANANDLLEQLKAPFEPVPVNPSEFSPDALEPRGIGVLPLRNEHDAPDDDWLGYAVANYLSRALAEMPHVYVADSDGLVEIMGRVSAENGRSENEKLVAAGRLVGAGTVVTGRFRRDGAWVRIEVEALQVGRRHPVGVASVSGPLPSLGTLERDLLRQLADVLGMGWAVRERPRAPGLNAREKFVLAKQAFLRGDYERAVSLGNEALHLDHDFVEAIGFVGMCLARLGRYEEAEAHHRRQESLAQHAGDARREIESLANLGVMNYFRGDYEAAEGQFRRAAQMAEQLDLASESATISNNLGFVLLRRGDTIEAERAFRRAIDTHRAYGSLTSLIGPYNGLGNVLVGQARYEEARHYYRRALSLATEVGDRTSVGNTHLHLGRCAVLQGHFADAKHEFTMALNALEETRFWNGLARAYEYIAEMHLQLGNYAEATRCSEQRVELARQHSNRRVEAAAWLQKADALRRAGRLDEAAACQTQGHAAWPELGQSVGATNSGSTA